MRTDIDRPSTWKKYKAGMCEGCWAGCCVMPVEVRLADLIGLGLVTEDEAQNSFKKMTKRLMKEGYVASYRQGTDLFMLTQQKGGECVFLGKDRLCTVYDKRPEVCRKFPEIGPRPGWCPHHPKK